MKKIDNDEEEYLYNQKIREGKSLKEANKQLQRDKQSIKEISEKNRIKKAKLKKDPKELNKRFKEAFGNLK